MAITHRTAAQAGHARLYHYQGFCREWLADTLRERRIHCSNPANLNDPWDCKPWFNDQSIKGPDDAEKLVEYCRSLALRSAVTHPGTGARDHERRLRSDPCFRKEFIDSLSVATRRAIDARRIYCLTPDPCSTLMWSHYAAKHRGICLEYHVGNALFMKAWEVTYASEYPDWVPQGTEADALDMFLTKSDCWACEREFRVISASDCEPLELHGDFFKLPPGSLLSIIVGCEGDHAEVMRVVGEHDPGLPVKRMIRVPNHYRLTIECPGES